MDTERNFNFGDWEVFDIEVREDPRTMQIHVRCSLINQSIDHMVCPVNKSVVIDSPYETWSLIEALNPTMVDIETKHLQKKAVNIPTNPPPEYSTIGFGILKDGHLMFNVDAVKDLNCLVREREELLESLKEVIEDCKEMGWSIGREERLNKAKELIKKVRGL
ncbi:hypothetical protein DRO66_09235 [Candidatus Bathyarchaeota archaeon]|nr:MAG: hypothetical protein DRO66_09235 [Candidatus Bathyarchaeota archaeon]